MGMFWSAGINAALWAVKKLLVPMLGVVFDSVPVVRSVLDVLIGLVTGRVEVIGIAVSVPAFLHWISPWTALPAVGLLVGMRLLVRAATRVFAVGLRIWELLPFT